MDTISRVLMTADAVGGVWQYAMRLSALLANDGGTRVMLATMGPEPSPAQRAEALAIPGLSLRTSTFALEWMPDPWADVDAAGQWLLELEAEFAPDIIHLNGYCHGALPWQAPALVVGHSCVCSWWRAVRGCDAPPEWQPYIDRVRRGLQAARAVAAPSRAMADALAHFYDVTQRPRVIPNCGTLRHAVLGPKEPIVFAAGRVWDPAKNLLALEQIADSISWPVYIAGETAGCGVIRPSHEGARYLGQLPPEDVARWMSRAAIYALPAWYEPFGLSVLEAALSGCALVLGDVPSLRENWDSVARFVHPGSPDELRDALRELIDRPHDRDAMGQAARRRAEQFTSTRHVRTYESLYREMVTAHGWIAHSARSH